MADITVQHQFEEIVRLIQSARVKALQAVNSELINLYWQVGEYISKKIVTTQVHGLKIDIISLAKGNLFVVRSLLWSFMLGVDIFFYKQIAPTEQKRFKVYDSLVFQPSSREPE